jgi:protein translocase SecG subunit
MTIIENLWIIITIVIILLILSTDPKTSSTGAINKQSSMLSSVSARQSTIRKILGILIGCFYVLSLLLSYY